MVRRNSLIYNSIFNVVYQLLNVIFPFITVIYVSRILMAEGVGKVAYAQNIASYFTAMAPLGLTSYGVKEIAKTKNDPRRRNQCFSELFLINAVSTLIFTVLYYFMVCSADTFAKERLLYLVCGLPIVLNVIQVDWFYQGMEEYAYITLRSLIIKIISLFLLFFMVHSKADYVRYALITSLAGCANRVCNIIYLRRFIRFQWTNLQWKKHMRPVLILACNIFLSNIYSKVDVTMLGYWKTDVVTGYYSNAFKIVNIVISVCIAMTDVFLPRLSYIYCNDREKYQRLLNQGVEIVLTLVFPASLGLSLLADRVIPLLFGADFAPAALTVVMMSPLVVIKGFGNLACYQTAISSGNEKKQTYAYILGCLVNVMLNGILIPRMGQNGAAIASVIAEVSLNTLLFLQLRKLSKIAVEKRYLSGILVSCLFMAVAVILILRLLPRWTGAIAAILIGGGVYGISCYFQGNKLVRTIIAKAAANMHRKMGGAEK